MTFPSEMCLKTGFPELERGQNMLLFCVLVVHLTCVWSQLPARSPFYWMAVCCRMSATPVETCLLWHGMFKVDFDGIRLLRFIAPPDSWDPFGNIRTPLKYIIPPQNI